MSPSSVNPPSSSKLERVRSPSNQPFQYLSFPSHINILISLFSHPLIEPSPHRAIEPSSKGFYRGHISVPADATGRHRGSQDDNFLAPSSLQAPQPASQNRANATGQSLSSPIPPGRQSGLSKCSIYSLQISIFDEPPTFDFR